MRKQRNIALSLGLGLALTVLAGCGGNSPAPAPPVPQPPAALSANNVNLIFVASEDLAHHANGDIDLATANLTSRGLRRSLQMATFLQQKVLGKQIVIAIYALEPMTHLQTASNLPDMVGLEAVEQFALLNQITLSYPGIGPPYPGHSFPINSSYSPNSVPEDVAVPSSFCANCQGLDFKDEQGDNEKLVSAIVKANQPGFYVFSAPWETVSALMASINRSEGYNLTLPTHYINPNYIYAISITPSGSASLIAYNSNLDPAATYPVLSPPPPSAACLQTYFSIPVTGGQGGAVVPAGINTNETVYIIRHADAHPKPYWNNNNYVGAGQWRALDLPNALRGKISPEQVYSIDPSQAGPGSFSAAGDHTWSSVAPALTAEPYAIANGLPYHLVTDFDLSDPQANAVPTSNFFFTGGKFSNRRVLVAWAYQFIQPAINALLASYHGNNQAAPAWPPDDYDSVWTVQLDAVGNVTVSNGTCEGIDSSKLPATPPQF
jgi:hypothetical protein